MKNYFPNDGAEDATRNEWAGTDFFGNNLPGVPESSTELPHTGNRSVRVAWPEADGSGKNGMVRSYFHREGISGLWRVGGWVYVPAGSPDVKFGQMWAGSRVQVVTQKDTWVNVEVVFDAGADIYFGNILSSAVKLETTSAAAGGIAYVDDVYAYPGESGADSNEPEILVDIAWGDTPFEPTPTWDDITEYVQAVAPKHGRPNEIGSPEAGTCQLVLDNGDGRFTPKRADSPYFPNIKPRRPVRVRALWDGAYWPLFRGHVDRWPAETVTDSTNITVELVDIFGVFSKMKLQDPYLHAVKSYGCREVYPLNDGPEGFAPVISPKRTNASVFVPAGSLPAETETGSRPTLAANAESIQPNGSGLGCFEVSGVAIADGQPATSGMTGRGVIFPWFEFDTRPESTGWAISFFHSFEKLPPSDIGPCLVLRLNDAIGGMLLEVVYNANPFFKGYTVYWPNADTSAGAGPIMTYEMHYDASADAFTNYRGGNHVIISFDNDCRRDGSNVPGIGLNVNGYGSYRENPPGQIVGRLTTAQPLIGALHGAQPHEGIGANTIMSHDFKFSMFSIHDMPIGGWDLYFLRQRAAGNPGQSPADRLTYFLTQMGWDMSMAHIDATDTQSRLRFLNWEGPPNALDELRKVASDTNGLLYVNPAGQVTFQSRRMRQNPAPHLIFDHDEGTGIETPLNFDMSEQDIMNVVNVDNAYGVKTQVRNEESVAYYDEVEQERSVRLESDAEAVQFGYYLVNRFSEAQLRIDSVIVNPSAHATGALWGHVLSGGLSTVIGLRGLPESAPDAEADYFIESVGHEVERSGERLHWRTTYQVSPTANREAWILGDDTYGVLGQSTRLHY